MEQIEQLKLVIEEASRNAQHSDGLIRRKAEQIIKEFPSHAQALQASKFIMDTSIESIAQFHAANTIKEIITRQSYRQSYQEKLEWVRYLVMYVIERYSSIQHHVRGAIFQAVAISTKLGWMDSNDLVKADVMGTVSNLISNESTESKTLGLFIVSALLNEFLFTNGTTSLGLPLDFHHSCQRSFQKSHLLELFQMVLQCAHLTTTTANPEFANLALSCVEKILSWDFQGNPTALLGKKSEISVEKEKIAPRLPLEWKHVILVPEVVHIFFQLAHLYSSNGNISSKAITCLVQLAGIHGPVIEEFSDSLIFLTNFTECFQIYTSSVVSEMRATTSLEASNVGDKIFAIAQISKQLFARPKLETIGMCNNMQLLLTDLGQITLFCLKLRLDNVEDTWFLDAIDDMLSTWAGIISKTHEMSKKNIDILLQNPVINSLMTLLSQISFEIVQGYIEMRVMFEPSDDVEEDGFNQKDVDFYSDQLLNISILARLRSSELLDALIRLLNEKAATLSSSIASSESSELVIRLQEQLHWGILIAGHVLCDGADGEVPMIPESMLLLSSESCGGSADLVVSLSTTIFGILDSLGYPLNSTQHSNCSPLLIETLFWFCSRWSCSYLFPNPHEYSNLSLSLQQSFGETNGGGATTLTFLLQKIDQQIQLWYNEPDIVDGIILLLQKISKNKLARDTLFQIPKYGTIVQFFLQNVARLPANSHSKIIQTIVRINSQSSNEAYRITYFNNLCDSIEQTFLALIQNQNFTSKLQSTSIREKVVVSLQLFGGLALAVDESNTVLIFEALSRHFSSLIRLLDLYHSYPDVELYILNIFKNLVKNQSFDALQSNHQQQLHQAIHELIQVYTKNEVGRYRSSNNVTEEEELLEDLSVLFQLLSELITSEYEGYERDTILERLRRNNSEMDVPKVVFVGVNSLLPLVTKQMLEYPQLLLDYVYLVGLLVDYFPDRLSSLPPSLLSSLLESLMFGMNQSGMDNIAEVSFEALQTLGLYHWSQVVISSNNVSEQLSSSLRIILTQIMQNLLLNFIDVSCLNSAADCVFSLSLTNFATLQEIFHTLLQNAAQSATSSNSVLSDLITRLVSCMVDQHQKQIERLMQGLIEIGWGSPGLERVVSLRIFRKLFSEFVLEARRSTLVK